MDPIIVKGVVEAPFPNTYSTALLDVLKVIKAHTPSLSASDEAEVDNLRCDLDTDAADLALRTCHCGTKIDGFYEYVDHIKSLLGG